MTAIKYYELKIEIIEDNKFPKYEFRNSYVAIGIRS